MSLGHFVPQECRGWAGDGKDAHYTQEGIYKYMDGAGELYREYDYRDLFVRRFLKAGRPPITVELFDMGSAGRAFGVFSHTRDGPEAGIGQDSEYRAGLLCFWKGPHFACVRAEEETAEAKAGVLEIGGDIAAAIKDVGAKPDLLRHLPADGLILENVRYFFTHTCLNYHYFVSDDNILKLGRETEAVLAPYRQPGGRYYLLLVRYPTSDAAKAALDGFWRAYLPEGRKTGSAKTENGKWVEARMQGQTIALIFDAASKDQAAAMLSGVVGSLPP